MSKERKFEVFHDAVTHIYENGKPVVAIIKYQGHEVPFSMKEMHGSSFTDVIQAMATLENKQE